MIMNEYVTGIKAVNFMETRTNCDYYYKLKFIENVVKPYIECQDEEVEGIEYAVHIQTLEEYVFIEYVGRVTRVCISADSTRAIMQDIMKFI